MGLFFSPVCLFVCFLHAEQTVLSFVSVGETLSATIQIKAAEHYFPVSHYEYLGKMKFGTFIKFRTFLFGSERLKKT